LKLENYIKRILEREYTPSISILVSYKDQVVYKKTFGYLNVVGSKIKATNKTIYDLASLTKPLVIAPLILFLLQNKEIKLGDNVNKFFPEFNFDFTILNLLIHTSGLPGWIPFYAYNRDYLDVFNLIRENRKASKRVVYSCVGYILLSFIINKVINGDFRELYDELFIKKLKLRRTFLKVPEKFKKECAATENGSKYEKEMVKKMFPKLFKNIKWREYLIQGETHDNNAYYCGGCAGNAGLFSDIEDMNVLLNEFKVDNAIILKPEYVKLFYENFTPCKISHRTIGFKLNSSIITSGGKYLSKQSIGHNGFTGTSMWIDPIKELDIIVLTNRIHPRYKTLNFNRIRRHIHKLISKELIRRDYCK